ncbi:MAG TPA: hypothetical protein VGR28_15155 [Candidatus Thermoplasmatota archaeon]|jgi:hypothetical protein|nr:hypothetical protein [Candidatus Thermoplasmatota archaeon]
MRKTLMLAAVAAVLVVPSIATAVHGSPYTAKGIAVDPLTGAVLEAEVSWTGWWTQTFIVKLNGVTNLQSEFRGLESWSGPIYYNTEFFSYHGWSADPAVHFDITGFQIIHIPSGTLTMAYRGTYENYNLVLVV